MCQPRNIAANPLARVDLCFCGCLHVHIGPVMIRLAPEMLAPVVEVFDLAIVRLTPTGASHWLDGRVRDQHEPN